MEVLKARYPKAVCLKSRNGYAVYTRKFGTRLSEAKTKKEAWQLAQSKLSGQWYKPCLEIVRKDGNRNLFDISDITTIIVHQKSQAEVI